MTTTPVVMKRTTIEARATVDGLLDAIALLAQTAPATAEIVDAAAYYACPEEFRDTEDAEDIPDHDPEAFIAFTVEWEAA